MKIKDSVTKAPTPIPAPAEKLPFSSRPFAEPAAPEVTSAQPNTLHYSLRTISLAVQPKLTIGQPNDKYEPVFQRRKQPNCTGLPENLKAGIENLSGLSMDSVRVHHNSSRPAQINALAYAQGHEIHVAPGQEQHLPHEAWHVVQQAQGRVKPTMQLKDGVTINNNQGLEHEADEMGAKALGSAIQLYGNTNKPGRNVSLQGQFEVIQREEDEDEYAASSDEDEYAPPPLPTVWDFVRPELSRADVKRRRRPTIAEEPTFEMSSLFPEPEPLTVAPASAPLTVASASPKTPAERQAARSLKNHATGTQNNAVKSKKKFRGTSMPLTSPDVGGYLNTLLTPGHANFTDIVIFTLNNNLGFSEIHVHRGAAGVVLQISKKQTGDVGNGTPVPQGTPLYNEAVAASAHH